MPPVSSCRFIMVAETELNLSVCLQLRVNTVCVAKLLQQSRASSRAAHNQNHTHMVGSIFSDDSEIKRER